jgi:hypothetical protein
MSTAAPTAHPVEITFEMAMQAITNYNLPPASYMVVIKDLIRKHGWYVGDYDMEATKKVINLGLNFVWGDYRFIEPEGGISSQSYIGLPAAHAAAHEYSPRARILLITSGGHETAVEAAIRFISASYDDTMVHRLLDLSMKLRDPIRNTPGHRGFMIGLAHQRIAAQS